MNHLQQLALSAGVTLTVPDGLSKLDASDTELLALLLLELAGIATNTAASAGGGVPVTQHAVNLGASASVAIPAGAKGWTVSFLTGTGSIGAATALPAGLSDSDPGTLAASLTVSTDAASSAYVRWAT